jgi:hypothetical protein
MRDRGSFLPVLGKRDVMELHGIVARPFLSLSVRDI